MFAVHLNPKLDYNMTTNNTTLDAILIERTTIGDIADETVFHLDDMQSIDGGDHQINIWKNATGKTKISIQGTGEGVTLLTVNHTESVNMGASQWADDDHAAVGVRPH